MIYTYDTSNTINARELKSNNVVYIRCTNCGLVFCKKFRKERFNNNRVNFFKCRSCIHLECDHAQYDKMKKTNLSRYGCEYPLQNTTFMDKLKNTNVARYGTHCTLLNTDIIKKSKETKMKLYCDENYTNREKCKNTMLERHGVEYPMQYNEGKTNFEKSMFNNYGVKYSGESKNLLSKSRKTMLEMYGEDSYLKTGIGKSIFRKNRLEYPEKYESKKIVYFGVYFDSIPELSFYIYSKFIGCNVTRLYRSTCLEYTDMFGNKHYTTPDFMINGQYVEIKGGHFYNPDGTWKFPYKKKKVNGKWVPMTPEEIEYMNDLYRKKQMCLIANGVIIIRDDSEYMKFVETFVYQIIFLHNQNWYINYIKTNQNNFSYGYTPFNCDMSKEFQDPLNIGVTPFDIEMKQS